MRACAHARIHLCGSAPLRSGAAAALLGARGDGAHATSRASAIPFRASAIPVQASAIPVRASAIPVQEREEMARTLLAEHRSAHELQHNTMLIECRQTAPTMGPPMGQDPGADVGGVSPVLVQMWEG